MEETSGLRCCGGIILTIGGILIGLGVLFHPHGGNSMLAAPHWSLANWLMLIGMGVVALAIWVLMDSAWSSSRGMARIGGRLAILGCAFMLFGISAALAAASAATALASGTPVPAVHLFDTGSTLGWPMVGLAFILLCLGAVRAAPLAVRIIGALGGLGVLLAGILAAGLQMASLTPLFFGGLLIAIWLIWAGIQTATYSPAHARPAAAS